MDTAMDWQLELVPGSGRTAGTGMATARQAPAQQAPQLEPVQAPARQVPVPPAPRTEPAMVARPVWALRLGPGPQASVPGPELAARQAPAPRGPRPELALAA